MTGELHPATAQAIRTMADALHPCCACGEPEARIEQFICDACAHQMRTNRGQSRPKLPGRRRDR